MKHDLDPIAEYIIKSQHDQVDTQAMPTGRQAEPTRETRLRPHETKRRDRQMNVTFQSAVWPDWLRRFAELRGLRPADLIVWCVSYAIAQIKDGAVTAPSGVGRKQHHTACEWLSLPWRPEEETT